MAMKQFMIGVVLKAKDELSGAFKASTVAVSNFQKQTEVSKRNLDAVTGNFAWKTAAVGATAMAAGIGLAVKAYGDLATAQGEIASLGIGDEGIQKITKAAMEFSNQWSGTTAPEFISAAYDIKGGINSLGDAAVGEFTKVAAITGKATKSTTQEMTSLFAVGYGIYRQQFEKGAADFIKGWDKMSDEAKDIEFAKSFGSGITAAVNVFKSDGQQMSQALQNLGSSATAVGVSFAEQLAVLGQAQATYKGGSEAASGYKSFLSGVATAQDKLGISFQDSEGKMLPMVEIIGKLKKKFGDTISVTESKKLQEAFGGQEAIKFINTFWNSTDQLTQGVKTMGEEVQKGTQSIENMANAMNKGPNERAKVMSQRFTNLQTSIGQAFAPAAIVGIDALSGLFLGLQKVTDKCPALTAGVLSVITVLLSLATVIPVVGAMWPMYKAGFKILGAGIKTVFAFGKAFILTMAKMAVAAATNPITWIILGVVALGVAAFLLIKNWKKVSAFFVGLWKGIVDTFKKAWKFIWGALDNRYLQALLLIFAPVIGIPVLIIKNWKVISGFFSGLWSGIRSTASAVWSSIKAFFTDPIGSIQKAWTGVANFFDGIWDGVKNAAGAAWDWISSKILGVWNAIKSPFEAVQRFFGGGSASSASPSGTPVPGPRGTPYPTGSAVTGGATNTNIERGELHISFDNLPRGARVDQTKPVKGASVYAGYANAY